VTKWQLTASRENSNSLKTPTIYTCVSVTGGRTPQNFGKLLAGSRIWRVDEDNSCRRQVRQRCSIGQMLRESAQTFLTVPTVKNLKFLKSKMVAAAILKNRKITISRSQFKRFLGNLARWHSSTFLALPVVKNLKFQKNQRWRRPPSWIIKNHHMSAGIGAI